LKKLNGYRNEIDTVDKKIVELLNERAELATKIGNLKSKSGREVYDPAREKEVLKKLGIFNKLLPEKSLRAIYTEIISASRSLEEKTIVAYLGPAGTFAHEVALLFFGSSCNFIPARGFGSVFNEVEKDNASFGVLPIENSIEGSVNLSLDLLAESSLRICAEKSIPANHNLLSRERDISRIKTLYSHIQPLGQCRKFINSKLSGVKIIETYSTSASAEKASKTKNSAAIASLTAAKIYGLNILKKRVQDYPKNITRFIVLAKNDAERVASRKYKTSISVTVANKAGALHKLLGLFEKKKINLTKIVSRPSSGAGWGYLFYIDFEGHRDDKKADSVLQDIEATSKNLKIFGSYPAE